VSAESEIDAALCALWPSVRDPALRALLPRDAAAIGDFYPRLQRFVADAPRAIHGTIDRDAIVRGDVIALGEGSIIEAGAVIHESCRLIAGRNTVVRAGSFLRGEVVVGDECLIGSHCDVTRSVLLGPATELGHAIVFNDSIAGAGTMLSAFVGTANTHLVKGKTIAIRTRDGRFETGRQWLGALIGEHVRIGPNATLSPGTIVREQLALPPASVLVGIIDAERREQLMRDFFERAGLSR
jgi:UDP-3-O-[3-hydroxymyristoyl] glucosamine N-acyltransferase